MTNALDKAAVAVPEVAALKIDKTFRFDDKAQHHVPTLLIEFEPVPVGAPTDAKGWADRDALAAALAAPGAAQQVAMPEKGAAEPTRDEINSAIDEQCGDQATDDERRGFRRAVGWMRLRAAAPAQQVAQTTEPQGWRTPELTEEEWRAAEPQAVVGSQPAQGGAQ
jgi:hypothetical protein